jgi:NCAIR mutase (PurE)-related protein
VRFDWDRTVRTGVPEAVFCEGKTSEHLRTILSEARDRSASLFLTRLAQSAYDPLSGDFDLDYCALSRTAIFGRDRWHSGRTGEVGVVCAGTSDMPVAEEARRTLGFFGFNAPIYADVGVAGLWRLMSVAEELSTYRVLIAVAGMEGALFSALAGLVPGLVIAVPSPVGYGVSAGGEVALKSALASCAPGVVTMNVGNGFGAAAAACKILAFPKGG